MNRTKAAALWNEAKKCMTGITKSAGAVLAALALASTLIPAQAVFAETEAGSNSYYVTFTENKAMDSNVKSGEWNFDDDIRDLQPGDSATFTIKLTNSNEATTDWYMTNEVMESLEDNTKSDFVASGAAYTYKLTYTDPMGSVRTLFDSDEVGGDDKASEDLEGLKEATNALRSIGDQDYLYLDQLTNGQSGQIDLEVGLDGETQGNDYQDTLANLKMNFAVELSADEPGNEQGGDSSTATTATSTTTTTTTTTTGGGTTTRTTVVKTGDDNKIMPYVFIAGACGLFILFFAIFCVIGRRKEREGGSA